MGALLLGAVLFLSSFSASADLSLLDTIKDRLVKKTELQGDFSQTKYIKQMDTSLDSSGRFKLNRKAGLEWEQSQPFAFTMQLTQAAMTMKRPGEKDEVMTKEQNPMVFGFAQTFLGLFSGEFSQLKEQFEISAEGTAKNWMIKFLPKSSLMKKALRSIQVLGNDLVNSVKVDDTQGNTMTIRFTKVQAKP